MKRLVFLLVLLSVCAVVRAQDMNGPAQAPSQSEFEANDHGCAPVHPGDTINYTLTIENVGSATGVFAELQLRPGRRGGHFDRVGLPSPTAGLNMGGAATRVDQDGNEYHITFKVPEGLDSGVYHGVGVLVTVNDSSVEGGRRMADVTHKSLEQIYKYCVVLYSGGDHYGNYPVVTNFKPGVVEKK
jgi:hypothetical protein